MPNKRDPNKIRVQTWVSREDKKALEQMAKDKGYDTLADFLSAIAKGAVKLILFASLARWPFHGSFGSAFCATVSDAFSLATWTAKAVIAMAA